MMDQAQFDQLSADVAFLVARQRKMEEFVDEMAPIARLAMGVATERLQAAEEKGYFRFAEMLLNLSDRVVTHYSESDLAELTSNGVRILDTLRTLTQPEVMQVLEEMGQTVQNRDQMQPLGVGGLVRAGGEEEVQRGLAVVLELLRQVGRAAGQLQRATPRPAPRPTPAATPVPAAPPATPKAGPAGLASSGRYARPSACKPSTPGVMAQSVGGVAYTADGFLVDSSQWNRELAQQMASSMGVTLEEQHWKLLDFAREEWQTTGVSPNIRRLTTGTEMSTRDLYALFPKAPGKAVARLAGVPKPAGCI